MVTLGPASGAPATLAALIEAGMDVARLNFSHGSRDEHATRLRAVRAAAAQARRPLAVLADLQGPRIRLGVFAGGAVTLADGADFTLTTETVTGDAHHATVSWPGLPRAVRKGSPILIADGSVRLEVVSIAGAEVRCRVIEGGPIGDHKGVNLPGTAIDEPALTPRDADDLRFALDLGVDAIALSFVRAARDVDPVRAVMRQAAAPCPVIAKLERPEAVEQLDAILERFDGLMVARGDLGVEMPLEQVPLVQKRAVARARMLARPVIVATQMLESMIHEERPTRAEASDVANAVLDGADALMLSAETSIGEHPVEAVRTMAKLIAAAETARHDALPRGAPDRSEAMADAAVALALQSGARALVTFTRTGATARRLARHRAALPLLAFTPDPAVARRLSLTWGVHAFEAPQAERTDATIDQVERSLLALQCAAPGDTVVLVMGRGEPGSTDTIRLHRVGASG